MDVKVPYNNRKRQRARKACTACQQRKKKCDGNYPCGSCDGFGYVCTYSETASESPNDGSTNTAHTSTNYRASTSDRQHSYHSPTTKLSPHEHSIPQEQGVIDSVRSRYTGRESSLAFPQSVGMELQLENPPRLHSYAYHLGVRAEPKVTVLTQLKTIVTFEDFEKYARSFFRLINPMYDLLEEEPFLKRSGDHYFGERQDIKFEILMGLVVVLGSLFSTQEPLRQEADVMAHVERLFGDPAITVQYSIDYLLALCCRCIYYRSTSRPGPAWLASCTTLHIAESLGLHKDVEKLIKVGGISQKLKRRELDTRCRIFWVCQSIHRIMAIEYSRTPIAIQNITCRYPFEPGDTSPPAVLCALMQRMPKDISTIFTSENEGQLLEVLEDLRAIPKVHPKLHLASADVSWCLYRWHRLIHKKLSSEEEQVILSVGKAALSAARELTALGQPWWHLTSTVFQFCCICIAIDSTASLLVVGEALDVLEQVRRRFDTHMTTEAVTTAQALVDALKAKKRKELLILEQLQQPSDGIAISTDNPDAQNIGPMVGSNEGQQEFANFQDLDWDIFLDPQFPSMTPADLNFYTSLNGLY